MNTTEIEINQLTVSPGNLNVGTERGASMLTRSLRQFGPGRSVLIDKDGQVIAGNHVVEEAAAMGIQRVLVIQTHGESLVAVQRLDLDLDHDPEGKARGMALADNRVSEVNLSWDNEALLALAQAAPAAVEGFFSDRELLAISNSTGRTSPAEPDQGQIIITCPHCGGKLTPEGHKA